MSRSSKKGPFVEERLLARIQKMNEAGSKQMIRTYFTVAFASTCYLTVVERSPRACERNVRVGANSPSLCPTIDSEM